MNEVLQTWTQLRESMGRLGAALPGPIGGLAALQRESLAAGALGSATKELIALAVAIALPEDRLIPAHVHDALASGATDEELMEAVGVAVLMAGATAAVRASEVPAIIAAFREDGVRGRRHETMRVAASAADLGNVFTGQDGDDAGLG